MSGRVQDHRSPSPSHSDAVTSPNTAFHSSRCRSVGRVDEHRSTFPDDPHRGAVACSAFDGRQPTLEEALAEAETRVARLRQELESNPAANRTRQQAVRQRAAEERPVFAWAKTGGSPQGLLHGQGQYPAGLVVHFESVARVDDLVSDTGQCVDHRENC